MSVYRLSSYCCVVLCCIMITWFYLLFHFFFFFKQKTAYEMRISDWSSACALPICLSRPLSDEAGADGDRSSSSSRSTERSSPKERMIGGIFCPLEIGRASCRERVCQYV